MEKEAIENTHEQQKEFLKKAVAHLEQHLSGTEEQKGNVDYFKSVLDNIDNAEKLVNTEEKEAHLTDACTRWANQASFLMFRNNVLGDELANELRKLPSAESTTAVVKEFADVRQAEIDRINAEQAKVNAIMDEIELFRAVIGGMDPEEAAQKQAEYKQRVQATQQPQQ